MTDETTPTVPTTETPRRRRRATAPAGRPPATEPAAESAQGSATEQAQEPAVAAGTEPQSATVGTEPDLGDQQPTAPAAKKPARRSRRATVDEPAQAPDAPAAGTSSAVEEAAPASVVPAEASPEAKPRRGRGTRTRRTEAAGPADEPRPDQTEQVPADQPAEDPDPSLPRGGLDVLAELARPGTAVVFQAPTQAPSRRRRAGAPAGPPQPEPSQTGPSDPAVVDAEDALTDDDAEDVAEDALEDAAEDGQDLDGEEGREARSRRRRRRGGRGRRKAAGETEPGEDAEPAPTDEATDDADAEGEDDEPREGSRRRRRRRRSGRSEAEPRRDEVTALKGSTRLEAKRQRRREGRDAGRRRAVLSEAEFLARREAVERAMVVREANGRVQIAVLEDGVLVEHFVSRAGGGQGSSSMIGNVYLGRVQNVLPSMEAAFVDIGKGRNAVLYAGEVNWDAAGLEGQPRRIEQALKSGDSVLVQVTKDPIGHKGARLTSQVTLAGRYLVLVPAGGMTGISRKLPENERARLKKLLREIVPDGAGVIVRTAAEGASEEELRRDVKRLTDQWAAIEKKSGTASAPAMLQGEPDLAIRVVRDIFNDDFTSLVVQGEEVWTLIHDYVSAMAPDLYSRVSRWTGTGDVFGAHRIDEQLAKGMDRKVWLPSGGSLVIDRTEAMTVIDVNTGKFTGSGGTLEETVTRNNLEAAEEIVRQLRLRDIGGIIVIDFIDMVLESNRDLVLRRLVECLGRDRTKHQVAEVTSLGLVQMTRKRVGQGLVEAFSETCQACSGRGFLVRTEPVEARSGEPEPTEVKRTTKRKRSQPSATPVAAVPVLPQAREAVKATLATIAAAAAHAHEHEHDHEHPRPTEDQPTDLVPVGGSGEAVVMTVEMVGPAGSTRPSESVDADADRGEDPAARI